MPDGMNLELPLLTIAVGGFVVAFAHAIIPTHWLPFVLAGRGQRWSRAKTVLITALCGTGHVGFTTLLGVALVWFGTELRQRTGGVFPWLAGGALVLVGCYYLIRQLRGDGQGHHHGHGHGHDHGHSHGAHPHPHHEGQDWHGHEDVVQPSAAVEASPQAVMAAPPPPRRSDRVVILGLLALLTFSPCEGFLPVFVSGVAYGWSGFALLASVLAVATVAGMCVFTWLTLAGLERIDLRFLEKYEQGLLGVIILGLGLGIMFLGF